MTLAEFIEIVEREFDLDPQSINGSELLINDLGFDSLQIFRLALLLEAIFPGFEFPDQMSLKDVRLADAFAYAKESLNRPDARTE